MQSFSTYTILFAVCGLVILSYLFSVLNRVTRIPSVLLLLGTGILLRYLLDAAGLSFVVPATLVEFLGTIGLIMIVLEAGLDLEITRDRLPLIRRSFFSALVIFLVSSFVVAGILYWWLPGTPVINCLVYAIPLSIVSSAVVLPSVHHLEEEKKEFLIYEASFSDIIGIMVFNFFTVDHPLGVQDLVWFGSSIVVAVVLSVAVCFGLMWLLIRNRVNIKFFLSFAVLIVIYVGGKMMHLPALITILMFGLVINNWELIRWKPLKQYFSDASVDNEASFLKSITAESSFLIRTFFFVLFGLGIGMSYFQDTRVWQLGALIVVGLLALRFIYLRIVHRYNLLPELFYIPRGLITILLFYKIPDWQRIEAFDEGVLFFVILATALILMFGALLYRDRPVAIIGVDETAEV
ncbi:MAG: cation:proton antiporter [Saprospiraceae bacterium]|nr:cation:proton antiporter [Saprospiraceae bacterium]